MIAQLSFDKIAPFLNEPLVLIGFGIFLFFSFCRFLIARRIIPPMPTGKGFIILRLILTYGFILGLLIILLGFGLKYREMNHAEQVRAVRLIEGEVFSNLQTANELALNVKSILGHSTVVSDLLRKPEFPLLVSLFPKENRDLTATLPGTLTMAREALKKTKELRGTLPPEDSAKLAAVATAIRNSVKRTRTTMVSLGDAERKRYTFSTEIWTANADILRRISIRELSPLQESYARLSPLRSEYDAVIQHSLEFLDSVAAFLDPGNSEPKEQTLATLYGSERKFFGIVKDYGSALTKEIEALTKIRTAIGAKVAISGTERVLNWGLIAYLQKGAAERGHRVMTDNQPTPLHSRNLVSPIIEALEHPGGAPS